MSTVNIYDESRSKDKEYYTAYKAPYGKVATIHGFNICPEGIITMIVTPKLCSESEVRESFIKRIQYHAGN